MRQSCEQWKGVTWQKTKDADVVKLFREGEELFALTQSGGRKAKEIPMCRVKTWCDRLLLHDRVALQRRDGAIS